MRDRGSVVIEVNGKVLLIRRIRDGSTYYVFPGGGIESGETPEEAAKREALEELGVEVNVNDCIAKINFNGVQYYFSADIITGNVGTGQGEEFTDGKRDRGTYLPMWIDINKFSTLDVRPKEIASKVESLFTSKSDN